MVLRGGPVRVAPITEAAASFVTDYQGKRFHVSCRAVGTDLGTTEDIESPTQSHLLLWVPGLRGDFDPTCITMEVSNGIAHVTLSENKFPWLFSRSGQILTIQRSNQMNQSEETQVTLMNQSNKNPRPFSALDTSGCSRPKPSSAPKGSGGCPKHRPTAVPPKCDSEKFREERRGDSYTGTQTNGGTNRRPKPSSAPMSSGGRPKPRPTVGPMKWNSAETRKSKTGYQNTLSRENGWKKRALDEIESRMKEWKVSFHALRKSWQEDEDMKELASVVEWFKVDARSKRGRDQSKYGGGTYEADRGHWPKKRKSSPTGRQPRYWDYRA